MKFIRFASYKFLYPYCERYFTVTVDNDGLIHSIFSIDDKSTIETFDINSFHGRILVPFIGELNADFVLIMNGRIHLLDNKTANHISTIDHSKFSTFEEVMKVVDLIV